MISTEQIIYELTRIQINLKCYQENISDSSKKIDKLISYLKPYSKKKRKRPDSDHPSEKSSSIISTQAEIRNNSSFGSEVGDIVASLNCNLSKKLNTSKINPKTIPTEEASIKSKPNLNSSRECFPHIFKDQLENDNVNIQTKREERINRNLNFCNIDEKNKNLDLGPILKENKSLDNFKNSPIKNNSKTNKTSNSILSRFISANKRMRRTSNSSLKENEESKWMTVPLIESCVKKNVEIYQSRTHKKVEIFFSPRDLFEKQPQLSKLNKVRLSNFGKIQLSYIQSNDIQIKCINSTFRNKSEALPNLKNACTLNLLVKSENKDKNMSGMAFLINQSNDGPTSQISEIKEISAEFFSKNPSKIYLFLTFENKKELFSYSHILSNQIEDYLLQSIIEKKSKSYYPVFIKDLVVYPLTAELKSSTIFEEKGNTSKLNKEEGSCFNSLFNNFDHSKNKLEFRLGTEREAPLSNNFTINNNTITNNISSANTLCLNPNPKVIYNIFNDDSENQANKNLWKNNNNNNNYNQPNNQNFGNPNSSLNNWRNLNNLNVPQQIQLGLPNNQNISNFNWPSNHNLSNYKPIDENNLSIFNQNENLNNLTNQNFHSDNNFLNSTINDDYDNNMKWDRNF